MASVDSARKSPLLEELGRRVRSRRQERRWTLKQLAREAGLSERFVAELEAGRANISVLNLAAVARSLEAPLTVLIDPAARLDGEGRVVALLGLRGAGKSSVGRALAESLEVPFVELDQLVEQEAGAGLAEIFAIHGEEYFRRLERAALERFLAQHREGVLATGGGIVQSPETFALLRERCVTVWLKASPKDHWRRVVEQGDLRPMANRPQAMAELKRRLKEREPRYGQADHTCSTVGRSVAEVVADVRRRLGAS